MNLPFAPDATKKYAPVRLVNGITDAGHDPADVQVVVEDGDSWLVFFNSSSDKLLVP